MDPITGAVTVVSTLNGTLDTTRGLLWIGDTLYVAETAFGSGGTAILATIDAPTGNVVSIAGGPVLSSALGAIAAPR